MSNQTKNRRNPVAPTRYEGTYCNPFSDDAEELEAHETFATRAEAGTRRVQNQYIWKRATETILKES